MTTPFRILEYNIFTPVLAPIKRYGQKERIVRITPNIKRLDVQYDIDVLILNELIPRNYSKFLLKELSKAGFAYSTSALQDPLSAVDGGVRIVSKYPITQEALRLFKGNCAGTDCLSAKGVVYARIKKHNQYFNVFGTHMQAWNYPGAQTIRMKQCKLILGMIQSLHIPKSEAVILGGDMNIDRFRHASQFQYVQRLMHMKLPKISSDSEIFTVDPDQNQLSGSDEPSMYTSQRWPEGCVDVYFETMHCPCAPREWIDYVMYSTQYLQPFSSSVKAINLKHSEPFGIDFHGVKIAAIQDLSDHFPVLAQFEFPKTVSTHGDRIQKESTNDDFNTFNLFTIIMLLLLTILIVALLFGFAWSWKYSGSKNKNVQSR